MWILKPWAWKCVHLVHTHMILSGPQSLSNDSPPYFSKLPHCPPNTLSWSIRSILDVNDPRLLPLRLLLFSVFYRNIPLINTNHIQLPITEYRSWRCVRVWDWCTIGFVGSSEIPGCDWVGVGRSLECVGIWNVCVDSRFSESTYTSIWIA